jgi:DNA N-6-adenine-methyltransferase (Dam)
VLVEKNKRFEHLSERVDWLTPMWILDAARGVMGGIDLDPASSAEANKRVGASRFFTKEDDGLTQPWCGRVFVNPPGGVVHGRSLAGLFWRKLHAERAAGHVEEAVWVAFAIEHLSRLQGYGGNPFAGAVCVPAQRVRYVHPETLLERAAPPHASAVLYVGARPDAFRRAFSLYGAVT